MNAFDFTFIRDYYQVPARVGGRVRYSGHRSPQTPGTEGTIVGAEGPYLRVRLDGDGKILTLHPTYKLAYLD